MTSFVQYLAASGVLIRRLFSRSTLHYNTLEIDYGCIVYGSASEIALKHLDALNDAMPY